MARFRRSGRTDAFWALRLTVTAVAAYVVASAIFPHTRPLLAPLTALLVVQVTPVSLLSSGLDRVVSVVAGVESLAVVFSTVVPLTWWSLGVLIAASLLIGQVLRLQSNLIEVAISAMLVLGVGSLGAESAAWQRFTVTLVGAAVGIVANLVFPSKVATADAGRAIDDLADAMSRLLLPPADELQGLGCAAPTWRRSRAAGSTRPAPSPTTCRTSEPRCCAPSRAAGSTSAPWAPRTSDPGCGRASRRSSTPRSRCAACSEPCSTPPPTRAGPRTRSARTWSPASEQVFREMAAGIDAFGELVRVEADPERRVVSSEVERVQVALEGLHEARARLEHLLLLDTGPVLCALHATLLTAVKRLERELDLDERIRRQLRLLPRYGAGRLDPPAWAARPPPPTGPSAGVAPRASPLEPARPPIDSRLSPAPPRTRAGRRARARCAARTPPARARRAPRRTPRPATDARAAGPPPVCRSCTSSAAISTLEVAGSKTSTPNRCAPAYAAASARFFTTERVRVGGATFIDTGAPPSRATVARQRCSRLASA